MTEPTLDNCLECPRWVLRDIDAGSCFDCPLSDRDVVEVCVDCSAGIIVPKDRGQYTAYAFRHRLGQPLCERCYAEWLDAGQPFPSQRRSKR